MLSGGKNVLIVIVIIIGSLLLCYWAVLFYSVQTIDIPVPARQRIPRIVDILENVDHNGVTIWLAELQQEELEAREK